MLKSAVPKPRAQVRRKTLLHKSEYRNRVGIEREMRVARSNIEPQFDKMCLDQQAYSS